MASSVGGLRLIDGETRQCARCGEVYRLSEFTPHGKICAYCKSVMAQLRGDAKKRALEQQSDIVPAVRHKRCKQCGEVRTMEVFAKGNSTTCGYCVNLAGMRTLITTETPQGDIDSIMHGLIKQIVVGKEITYDDVFKAEAWILERKFRGIEPTADDLVILRDAVYLRERGH